jgi:uncharacterized membrane protein YfcA
LNNFHSALILFSVGLVAGFININAGGGSTLTLPTLIFLGLNSSLANGTNRVGIFLQTITGIYSFKKEDFHQFDMSLKLSLLTLPGAIAGAILSLQIGNYAFHKILGVIMIGIIISMLIPKSKFTNVDLNNKKITPTVFIAMLFIGFYGGFIQIGVGFLLMAALNYLMKFNLVHVNMHKVFIISIYTVPALLIFALKGDVNWIYGLTLAAGNSFGAYWAVKFSVRGGEKWIKAFLIVAILIMSIKLFDLY